MKAQQAGALLRLRGMHYDDGVSARDTGEVVRVTHTTYVIPTYLVQRPKRDQSESSEGDFRSGRTVR